MNKQEFLKTVDQCIDQDESVLVDLLNIMTTKFNRRVQHEKNRRDSAHFKAARDGLDQVWTDKVNVKNPELFDKTTQEQQRIKIAESCGAEYHGIWRWEIIQDCKNGKRLEKMEFIPDYFKDLNAIHEAILTQSEEFQGEFTHILMCKGLFNVTKPEWAKIFIDIARRRGVIKE